MNALDRHAAILARDGWCILGQALPPQKLARIGRDLDPCFRATPFAKGPFYGEQTKRFGGLLNRSPTIAELALHPLVIGLVEQALLPWCERIALNLTQAIEIHPGALAQVPHRDQDMWGGPKGSIEYLINVMWPLVPFDMRNGGTRLWTGSHFDPNIPTLGKETAAAPTMGAGLGGVARAAGNAARDRVSSAFGLREAASQGRAAAWNALKGPVKQAHADAPR